MGLSTFAVTSDTNRGPSPSIWGQVRVEDIIRDPNVGWHFYEDFLSVQDTAATEVEGIMPGWGSIVGTGCSISMVATEVGGVIRLAQDGTGDDEVIITTGSNAAGMGVITRANRDRSAFEARVRVSDVTNNQSWFCGVTQEGQVTTDALFADGNATLNDVDMIGYRVVDDDNDGLDVVYRINGGGGEQVAVANAQVLVANTWYKIGWVWDAEYLRYYVDGTQVGYTDVQSLTTAQLANFPNGEEYALTFGSKAGGSAINYDIDWIRYAQEAP
jgi:hypothetical protein